LVRALAEGPDPDPAAAKDLAMLTLREATARGFRPIVVHAQLALAHVLTLTGEPEPARTALQEAAELSKQLGLLREELEARESLASLLRQSGATKSASAETQAAAALHMRLVASDDN
jgi:hypothetical protein